MDFDQWVRDHWTSLVRLSRVIAGDQTMAEDVLQDALIDVYPRWSRLTMSGDPTWYIVRVITSKVANRRRTAWARKVIPLPQNHSAFDGVGSNGDVASINRVDVARALSALKPQQRSIVALHYLMDWPVSDIAVALKMPVGTVTSDLTRARNTLRRSLGGEASA
jgi:RNA polymerase sigma factor (sigma-70 family)